jgi:hypothetical protein
MAAAGSLNRTSRDHLTTRQAFGFGRVAGVGCFIIVAVTFD